MRHRVHHRKLNRISEHRVALRRNLAQSLFEHGRITTTLAKAKDVRPFVERLVTLAVTTRKRAVSGDSAGSLRARRQIHRLLSDRAIIPAEHRQAYNDLPDAARAKALRMASGRRYRTGEPKGRLAFTAEAVSHRLIEKIAPRFADRPGGYTRVIRLPSRRVGDHTPLAMIQFVGEEEAPTSLTRAGKTARQRRVDSRYAFAVRCAKAWSGRIATSGKAGERSVEAGEPGPSESSAGNAPTTGTDASSASPAEGAVDESPA